MSETLVAEKKSLVELEMEFLVLQSRRQEYEEGSDLHNTFTTAIHFVLEQAVEIEPSLKADIDDKHYKATFYVPPSVPKKGLLK